MAEVILKEDLKVSYTDLIAKPANVLGYADSCSSYDYIDHLCQNIKEKAEKKEEMKVRNRNVIPFNCCVKRIIFNNPATIVFWKDGSKTVVKCIEGEKFVPYYGFLAALAKKVYGTNSEVNRILKDAIFEEKKAETKVAIHNKPIRDEKGKFISEKTMLDIQESVKEQKIKKKKDKEHKKK